MNVGFSWNNTKYLLCGVQRILVFSVSNRSGVVQTSMEILLGELSSTPFQLFNFYAWSFLLVYQVLQSILMLTCLTNTCTKILLGGRGANTSPNPFNLPNISRFGHGITFWWFILSKPILIHNEYYHQIPKLKPWGHPSTTIS